MNPQQRGPQVCGAVDEYHGVLQWNSSAEEKFLAKQDFRHLWKWDNSLYHHRRSYLKDTDLPRFVVNILPCVIDLASDAKGVFGR